MVILTILILNRSIVKRFDKWIDYKNRELEFKRDDMEYHLVIDPKIEERLDKIINDCFEEYSLFNLVGKDKNWYVTEEEEKQINHDLMNIISTRLTPVFVKQLELYYNSESITDVIAHRAFFKVTEFVMEQNTSRL